MLLILYTLFHAALFVGASSSISVSYPLDDQLPPIARIHVPYSWTFFPDTFVSDTDAALNYSASSLPAWLSFDPAMRTLSGMPSDKDEGSPQVNIIAIDPISSDSASSTVTLCVTPHPPPDLHIPVEKQFYNTNPSLSSVFLISNNSALYKSRPALRIPPKWSFSIGFEYDTFSAENNLYYAARQADGYPLPDWVNFNEHDLTFGGVTPVEQNLTIPHTFSLVLHASDQEGYSAASVPFDIVISAHDLSLTTNTLPTINVTTEQSFELTLNSAFDFSGVLLDGQPISPSNITSLDINTSGLESWLHYDHASKTLSGDPPTEFTTGVLPVVLTSSVNQTLHTNVMLAAVPSFFSSDGLDAVLVTPGNSLSFNLAQYFSNSSGLGKSSDVELTATYDPLEAGYFLAFDSGSDQLTGKVPANISYDHIAVTFTAYSHITHSTSHTSLPISLSASDFDDQHKKDGSSGLSSRARAKLLLGLKIAFGIVCGLVNIAIIFAVVRRCSRVPDSAIGGEEGRRAWTEEELKWYGIGIEVNGERYSPSVKSGRRGYGSSTGALAGSSGKQRENEAFGASLSRVLTRTFSNSPRSPLSPVGLSQNPGVIKKGEFMGRIRATARIVSDKYRRVVSGPRRPVISKPTLILTAENASTIPPPLFQPDLRPFEDPNFGRYDPSGLTTPTDSPSSSTDGRSIPRRRADFAPPRAPPRAHLHDNDHHSVDSVASSLASQSSTRTHEAEAVIQHARRATSVRSAASGASYNGEDGRQPRTETVRPRLVPFTSATRVPVPKLPSSFFSPDPSASAPVGQKKTKRVASQMAKVFRGAAGEGAVGTDELATGIEYVRALGDEQQRPQPRAGPQGERSPAEPLCLAESSQHTRAMAASGAQPAPRMLVHTGERFEFRVPIASIAQNVDQKRSPKSLEVRLVSGRVLPKFIRADLSAVPSGAGTRVEKQVVEFSGVPAAADVGMYEIGVYERGGRERVGQVVVEVVERRSG